MSNRNDFSGIIAIFYCIYLSIFTIHFVPVCNFFHFNYHRQTNNVQAVTRIDLFYLFPNWGLHYFFATFIPFIFIRNCSIKYLCYHICYNRIERQYENRSTIHTKNGNYTERGHIVECCDSSASIVNDMTLFLLDNLMMFLGLRSDESFVTKQSNNLLELFV